MSKVITVGIQKGGVGKTTTVASLGVGFAMQGYKVLLIDTDAQSNLGEMFGMDSEEYENKNILTLYKNLVTGEAFDPKEYIFDTEKGCDIVLSTPDLTDFDYVLANLPPEDRRVVLKKFVDLVRKDYDYILIDTNPSLNYLQFNSLCCADSVIIPLMASGFSINGFTDFYNTLNDIREYNPELAIEGVLFTMVNLKARITSVVKQYINQISDIYDDVNVFKTAIPVSTKAAELTITHDTIFDHKNNPVSKAYAELVKEIING